MDLIHIKGCAISSALIYLKLQATVLMKKPEYLLEFND
jgi:hypothetical protein